jgi:hypothetical protein
MQRKFVQPKTKSFDVASKLQSFTKRSLTGGQIKMPKEMFKKHKTFKVQEKLKMRKLK